MVKRMVMNDYIRSVMLNGIELSEERNGMVLNILLVLEFSSSLIIQEENVVPSSTKELHHFQDTIFSLI